MKDIIVLRKLEQPVHSGETEYGLLLKREGSGYWLVKQSAYARPGGTTETSELSFHIEKSFLNRATLETLTKRIKRLTGVIWRYSDCRDKAALIDLIGNNRTYY